MDSTIPGPASPADAPLFFDPRVHASPPVRSAPSILAPPAPYIDPDGYTRPAPVPLPPEIRAELEARAAREREAARARAEVDALTRPPPLAAPQRAEAIRVIKRMMMSGAEIVPEELAESLGCHETHVRTMIERARRGLGLACADRDAAIAAWKTRNEYMIQLVIERGEAGPFVALQSLIAKQGGFLPSKQGKGREVEAPAPMGDDELEAALLAGLEDLRAKRAARG